MSTGERRQELDGVRGVAILLVLVGHAYYPLAPLAAAGVTLFFVLSGYLIAGLLLAEHARSGRIRLGRFYRRRFTRLAPPLFVMLAAMGLVLGSSWRQLLVPATWLTNYTHQLGVDVEPFGHTWSLAVEEQFYLLFPLVLLGLLRLRRPAWALAALLAVLLVWRVTIASQGFLDYAYSSVETASVPILAGCLAALARWRLAGRHAVGAMVGLVALGVVPGLLGAEHVWLVVPVIAFPVAVVLVAASGGAMWLRWRPLTFCGVASYSLYLWHKPVSWLLDGHMSLAGVAVGAAVGVVAYLAVEAPIMRFRAGGVLGERLDRRPVPVAEDLRGAVR